MPHFYIDETTMIALNTQEDDYIDTGYSDPTAAGL